MLTDFPEFTPLLIEHKDIYNELVSEFPPFSDISFTTLQIWWNLEGKLSISLLNKNIVINYYLPFDNSNSGLSIIGKNDIDSSVQTVFDYLKSKSLDTKIVHMPEFVKDKILDESILTITEEPDYDEYILDSKALASLEGGEHGRTRRKVARFLRETEGKKIELKTSDLTDPKVRTELYETILKWEKNQVKTNDPEHTEHLAIKQTLNNSTQLETQHMSLYVEGRLYGVILYHKSHDKKYFILNHLKVDYSLPYVFDYMTHQIADRAAKEGVAFLNMEMDLGIESLKNHKMGLRPIAFFKKYTVCPKELPHVA